VAALWVQGLHKAMAEKSGCHCRNRAHTLKPDKPDAGAGYGEIDPKTGAAHALVHPVCPACARTIWYTRKKRLQYAGAFKSWMLYFLPTTKVFGMY